MDKIFCTLLSLSLIISPIPWNSRLYASELLNELPAQVFGISNGIIGSNILVKCKLGTLQPSIMLYMSGSIVYMTGEIAKANSKTKQTDEGSFVMDQCKNQEIKGGDCQKDLFSAYLNDEEENLRFIKKRKLLMTGVGVIYTAASVLALLETLGMVVKPDDGFCRPNPYANKFLLKALGEAYSSISSSRGNTSPLNLAGGLAAGVAANKALDKLKVKNTDIFSKTKIESITNFSEPIVVPFINKASTRAIYFTLLTTFIFAKGLKELNKEQNLSENYISDIKKTISAFDTESQDYSLVAESRKKAKLVTSTKELPQKRSCLGNDFNSSESACLNKLKIEKIKLDPKNYPQDLLSTINTIEDYTQAYIDGDFDRAESLSIELEKSASRLHKLKDELLVKTNQELLKNGKNPLNLEQEVNQQISKFNTEFKKEGLSPLSSDSFHRSIASGNSLEEVKDSQPKSIKDHSPSEKLPELPISKLTPESSLENLDVSNFKGGVESFSNDEVTGKQEEISSESSFGLAENASSQTSEISEFREVSLFKQLSDRYILNYSRLFKNQPQR